MKSGEGGLLQVCMEGVGLLFANSKVSFHFFHHFSCSIFRNHKFQRIILKIFKERKIFKGKFSENISLTLPTM